MKSRIGCLVKLILVFAGALVGLLAGLRGPELVHRGILVRWKPFDLPDTLRAVRFLEGEGPHVFIETEDGKRFSHDLSFNDNVEWHELDPAVTLYQAEQPTRDGHCRLSAPFRYDLIVLPSLTRVVDRIYCTHSEHAEYHGDLQFIIDGSGRVWRWLRTDRGYGILGWYPICGVIGVLFGALLGWLLHPMVDHLTRARREDQVEEARDRWRL